MVGIVCAVPVRLLSGTSTVVKMLAARGGIIDEKALHAVLSAGKLAGAGIDVFAVEPLPVDHPFRKLDNLVLTPHLGYATSDGLRIHYGQMVEAIDAFTKGSELPRKLA